MKHKYVVAVKYYGEGGYNYIDVDGETTNLIKYAHVMELKECGEEVCRLMGSDFGMDIIYRCQRVIHVNGKIVGTPEFVDPCMAPDPKRTYILRCDEDRRIDGSIFPETRYYDGTDWVDSRKDIKGGMEKVEILRFLITCWEEIMAVVEPEYLDDINYTIEEITNITIEKDV